MREEQLKFQFETDLLEDICSLTNLWRAFKLVKKNKGAPGIDKITLNQYEENIDEELLQLRQEVLGWKYSPTPVKRVEIPKPGGKGVRKLGIPIIKDRVLHMAIKLILEPLIDPTFSKSSFGFRPKRNQQQAVQQAKKIVQEGKEYIVDIDLSKFFDRIIHDRLIHRLKIYVKDNRVLKLIGMILRGGIMKDGLITPSKEGSVQGSPLSPLLSNVVLDELDKELEKRGLEFCRFADDCNIFVKSQRAAERVMNSIKKFIEKKLKLKVNEEKSKTGLSSQIKFLGMTIINGTVTIAKASYNKAMEKVKSLIPRRSHKTVSQTLNEVNVWFRGWSSYYKMTEYPAQLGSLEAHIRRRLRAKIIIQKKQRKHLVKALIKKGIDTKWVKKTVYSNRKTWALSNMVVFQRVFSVKWFVNVKKQFIISNKAFPHWYPIGKWLKLT